MGHLSLLDVFGKRPEASNSSLPIGASEQIHKCTATEIVYDPAVPGLHLFGDEIPVEYCSRIRITHEEVYTRRLEFKVNVKNSDITAGSVVFLSEYPYRFMWTASAKFKKPQKDVPRALSNIESSDELIELLEISNNDLFETRNGWLTASVEENQFRYLLKPSLRSEYGSLSHVYGIFIDKAREVLNIDSAERAIFSSKFLQEHLKHVRLGKPLGPEKNLFVPEELHDELTGLLWWSVKQSLAGPGLSAEKYEGAPVCYLARDIFDSHAFNFTRNALSARSQLHFDEQYLDSNEEGRVRLARWLGYLAQFDSEA